MKVALITTSYPRTQSDDSGVFVRRLVEAISNGGISGIVIAPASIVNSSERSTGNFTIEWVRYGIFGPGSLAYGNGIIPKLKTNPWLAFEIPMLVLAFAIRAIRQRDNYQIVHAQWLGSAISAFVLRLLLRKPYIVTVRGEDIRLLNFSIFRILLLPTLRWASAVTTVNKEFQERLSTLMPSRKQDIHYLPNGVDIHATSVEEIKTFHKKQNLADRYIIFVGSITPRKRIDLLIDLLTHESLSEFCLLLCGRIEEASYHAHLVSKAESLGIRDRIRFMGPIAPETVPLYLQNASVFVSASEFEGRPNSILEAFASKLPVVASLIPAHSEIIEHGKNGFLFDPTRLEAAADAINRLTWNPALRREISDEAFARVSELSWENTAKNFASLYHTICADQAQKEP